MQGADERTPAAGGEGQPGQSRLVAVVVGIDRYADRDFGELWCAVNDADGVSNAIQRTQPPEARDLAVLTYPARQTEGRRPTKAEIVAALGHAAEVARAGDTVLFFFAGHGELVEGRPYLVPQDARWSSQRGGGEPESLLGLDEVQGIFEGRPARRRVMFLDCCQTRRAGEAESHAPAGGVAAETSRLVEAIQRQSQGWWMLLSCSPGEESLEDPAWGKHGIFSHFLAEGLRGEADLNGDGVVSLAELVQYLADRVPAQAEAVIHEAPSGSGIAPAQQGQHPTLIWSGPIDVPVTHSRPEGRSGFQAAVFPLWARYFGRPSPYRIPLESRARFGGALLYGLAMALNVVLFGPPSPAVGWSWLAVGVGLASGLFLNASFALSAAANEIRWHTGGYRASEMLLLWHAVVLVTLVAIRSQQSARTEPGAALCLAVNLFVLISLIVVFATNAWNCLIALADLLRKNERVALRRAFVQLDQRWIHADVPNVIAMVSGHPKLYQAVGWSCCGLVLVHAIYVLLSGSLTAASQIALLRDAVLIVLIQWLIQWYSAAFRGLRGRVLSEK